MASLVSDIERSLASIATALPDAVRVMRHDAETGDSIRSSSVELSGEVATESGAVEKSRVIVTAANFPTLTWDSVVFVGDTAHVVTSYRTDPVGASATVGLSEPLSNCAAYVSGVRGNRAVRFPLDILAENNGLAPDYTDGYAPTTVHSWTLVVACDDWPESGEPQIGDEFRFDKDGEPVRVKVARCNRRERHYIISARSH